ncbi:MAG: Clp protease N-terminal domain-containing protein [Phycisphaerae bacterium]
MAEIDYRDPEWVAQKLGVERNTVYKFLQEGTIPAIQLGRKWLIPEKELLEWLAKETARQTAARRDAAATAERTIRRMDNFTPHAREAIRLAHAEARRYSHERLGQEHLLLGIVANGVSTGASLLADLGVEPEQVRAVFESLVQPGSSPSPRRLARTAEAREAMHAAAAIARQEGRPAGTADLLMGILQVGGLGREMLKRLSVTIDRLAAAITHRNARESARSADAESAAARSAPAGREETRAAQVTPGRG